MNEFNLVEYLNNGIKSVVTGISRASVGNLKTLTYMGHYVRASRNAEKLRSKFEGEGLHIPPFLICSITDSCNLKCAGCFAREADRCRDKEGKILLDVEEWDKLFGEAEAVGTGIAILAGGEPCPFSPFEGANLRESSYVEVLKAPLFNKLRECGLLEEKHDGGCILYIYEDRVREMIEKN
ncbi:MAG: 4Fe-4S cluster-binding domain-containing protein [Bacillota bacterium]|nr:4Fe-4S cluster-binding domain-containing protein [Bacillota bacterium]